MLSATARFSVRHRWLVVIGWLVTLVAAATASRVTGGTFSNDLTLSGTDSQAAYDTLRRDFPAMSGDGMQIVLHRDAGVQAADVRQAVESALDAVRTDPAVAAVRSPYGPQQPLVSSDGTTAIATVQFAARAKDIPPEAVERSEAAFAPVRDRGVQVEFGGPAVQTESGPSGSEIVGLAAAVLVLLVAFGSLLAMVVPIVTALVALGLGLSVIELLTHWVTIGTSGPVVAAMLGLGVGIDYALLVVTRQREGLAAGQDPAASIHRAMATAGRSVLVAGTTVILAILSLALIGIPFVSALALASAVTITATLAAALTLLPALLAIFGRGLDRWRVRRLPAGASGPHGAAGRWSRFVLRRRRAVVVTATVVLVVLAAPLTGLRLGTADGGSQSPETTQRRAYDLIAGEFGPGWAGPLLVTIQYPDGTPAGQVTGSAAGVRTAVAATAGVQQVAPPQMAPRGDTALLTVVPAGSPDDASTERLVHRLRTEVLPAAAPGARVHVGGATATSIDLADRLGARMWWFMLLVVTLAFGLLLIEFRSLLVPLVAVLMNLLAVGAAYGPVVAVFQWGWWPAALLGAQAGPVESFAPVMLFAVLFGLSTDYAVFLFGRIREEHLRTADARQAVINGSAATFRVILAAASVMVVVFAGFVLNDQRVVNLFGFGLATAIATYVIVAMLALAPATLGLLGRAAWWLPGRTPHPRQVASPIHDDDRQYT
ncbi:MMPL family transporter [Actinoplanes sp. NPDC049316]|uniref:MMPL family transporter n=1 Tax=Actinoplanes sp. NPDC049316 TaxID=3154727 RepID=UPI0034421737